MNAYTQTLGQPESSRASTVPEIITHNIAISLRSRIILGLMRLVFRPIVGRLFASSGRRMLKAQLQVASMRCKDTAGQRLAYRLFRQVPGHVVGSLEDPQRRVLLWLHGGGFVMPAAPAQHLSHITKLCRDLRADALVPDYRLAPQNPFPAGLDDCEQAYCALLDAGVPADRILLAGDSAGGNLVFGLLQRVRQAGLPMPACVVALSPVTEMGRGHAPPSRPQVMRRDPLLPILALPEVLQSYLNGHDSADPEVSPLYMDCHGLPPTYLLVSSNEILMDDSVMLAQRLAEAGVQVRCEVWPHFPHAFPLFESIFPEVAPARRQIVAFAEQHLA